MALLAKCWPLIWSKSLVQHSGREGVWAGEIIPPLCGPHFKFESILTKTQYSEIQVSRYWGSEYLIGWYLVSQLRHGSCNHVHKLKRKSLEPQLKCKLCTSMLQFTWHHIELPTLSKSRAKQPHVWLQFYFVPDSDQAKLHFMLAHAFHRWMIAQSKDKSNWWQRN